MSKRAKKKLRNQKRKVKLNKESIQEVIDELNQYKAGVELVCKEIAAVVGELGVEIAQAKLVQLGAHDTGELANSIHYVIDESSGMARVYIRADAKYAMYVEFGTGIMGELNDKHPMHSDVGWEHDVNDHGFEGWVYKGADGKTHRTWGQPARPFLYETVKELEQSIPEIVRKVFG